MFSQTAQKLSRKIWKTVNCIWVTIVSRLYFGVIIDYWQQTMYGEKRGNFLHTCTHLWSPGFLKCTVWRQFYWYHLQHLQHKNTTLDYITPKPTYSYTQTVGQSCTKCIEQNASIDLLENNICSWTFSNMQWVTFLI